MNKKLHDAADLLRMLDRLIGSYSEIYKNREDIPWAGIRLSLKQAEELIADEPVQIPSAAASENLPRGFEFPELQLREMNAPFDSPTFPAAPSMQGMEALRGGTVRELRVV